MIDRKSLFSTYLQPTCVTMVTSSLFEPEDTIVSGFAHSELGGTWPRRMRFLPERAKFWTQTVCDLFDYRFGPRRYRILRIENATQVSLCPYTQRHTNV